MEAINYLADARSSQSDLMFVESMNIDILKSIDMTKHLWQNANNVKKYCLYFKDSISREANTFLAAG